MGSDGCRHRTANIEGMWGIDGTLFFHTATQLVFWDGATFETLAYWPGEEVEDESTYFCDGQIIIRAIWGSSAEELFLAVEESERASALCDEYLMWWDGTLFHWF